MISYATYDEAQLVELLKTGDEAAFTEIYYHYSEQLYYNILALVKDGNTAEELVQDIFSHLKLIR